MVKRVMCKLGGTSTRSIDLGWVLDFGAINWTDLAWPCGSSSATPSTERCARRTASSARDARRTAGCPPVCDEKVKAKDGYTRVYIEINDEVQRYLDSCPIASCISRPIRRRSGSRFCPRPTKPERQKSAVIYRAGVFVREIEESTDESFTINFKQDELQIDECRNSSDLPSRRPSPNSTAGVGLELVRCSRPWSIEASLESSLDRHYICPSWETPKEEQQQAWQTGVAGRGGRCRDVPSFRDDCRVRGGKGHAANAIKASNIVEAAARFGVRTDAKVLTETEKGAKSCRPPRWPWRLSRKSSAG